MELKTLLISPVPSHPQDAGNRIRIFQLAEKLRAAECDVYYAYYDHEGAGGDYESMKRYWGEKVVFLSGKELTGLFDRKKNLVQRIFGVGADIVRTEPGYKETDLEPRDIDEWNVKRFNDILLK